MISLAASSMPAATITSSVSAACVCVYVCVQPAVRCPFDALFSLLFRTVQCSASACCSAVFSFLSVLHPPRSRVERGRVSAARSTHTGRVSAACSTHHTHVFHPRVQSVHSRVRRVHAQFQCALTQSVHSRVRRAHAHFQCALTGWHSRVQCAHSSSAHAQFHCALTGPCAHSSKCALTGPKYTPCPRAPPTGPV